MLPERFKTMFRSAGAASSPKPSRAGAVDREVIVTRQSKALEQFFGYIQDQVGLSILDLAGATQENVNFVTDLGHKLYTQDFLRGLDDTFGADEIHEQSSGSRIENFLQHNLDFPENSFDGVLIWDTMQYLSPALLNATIQRLHQIVRPRSYLLAFFTADEKLTHSPKTTFRIKDAKTLELLQRGQRKQAQMFNNRSLEKLFGQFESVKFFLTRESLREVIVKR